MKRLISTLSSLCLAATSLLGTVPGFTASAASVKADAPANTIVYDLVPDGKDYTAAAVDSSDNNVVKADPGEKIVVNWTVKNDLGTAGLQMTFGFDGVTFVSASAGGAYKGSPQVNKEKTATTGELNYAFATSNVKAAADGAVIYKFTVTAPTSGSGSVKVKTGSGINNKVVPLEDGQEYKYLFHGLTIKVDDNGGNDDTKPSSTTTTPGSKVDPTDMIIYNLVPAGKDYTAVADNMTGNNIVKAEANEEITVNWTVKNDLGTAGLQMTFGFDGVTFVSASAGGAYKGSPQVNKDNTATTGELNYAFATSSVKAAADDAIIYKFKVKAPASGSGSINIKTGSGINNKVVPLEDGKEFKYLLHGLTIQVSDDGPSNTTTTPGSKVDPTDMIIYNLVPAGKDYTAVADDMTGNNIVKAEPNEEITVNWTVKNDLGTAGLQMTFGFDGVTFVSASAGGAYKGSPQVNKENTAATGELNYAFATSSVKAAADDAIIYKFKVTAPASGSGSINIKTGSGINNKVVPLEDGKEFKYLFHGLTIQVGDDGPSSTTTTPGSKVDPTDMIIYNLVPAGKDYTAVADDMTGNNIVYAEPGEKLVVNWTVKNDLGTAGLQMTFGFDNVEFVSASAGGAYKGSPQVNKENTAATGELNYAFATSSVKAAADDAIIYKFTVNAPDSGTGTINIKTGSGINNKVVPLEDGEEFKYLFHGLTIDVDGDPNDPSNKIIYNIVPADKEYTAAADDSSDNNVVEVTPGEELTVNWTVKQDQGTAGIQMSLDFSEVTYKSAKNGGTYRSGVELNDETDIPGEVVFAMVSAKASKAADGAVIYSFNIAAPEKEGSYVISELKGQDNKVVPEEDGKSYAYTFHGLELKVKEAAQTTTTENIPAGSASWKIGKETASAGADVKVPVTVSGDQGTAGLIAEFAYDSKLQFNGITWGEGYTGEATLNSGEGVAVWADANGEDQKAADNAVVLYLNFTAPSEAGVYDVTFKNLEATNTSGNALTLTKEDGNVTVIGNAGSSNWKIGTETVAAGEKVKVPVTVSGDEGTAGIYAEFTADSALKFDGIEWADGYTGTATLNDKELVAVWAEDADQKAADNAVVLYLNFTAPAEAGEYPVEFKNLEVCNADGAWLKLTKENGEVIVTDPNAGSATWIIGEEVAEAGAQVKVPVTVTGDTGTAGFIVEFAHDSALTFTGFEWATGYTGKVTINSNEKVIVWADANGANQKAADDAVVAYLLFTAPEAAGEYPVTFKDLSVSNEDGAFLALTKEDGMVIVKDPNAGSANWIVGKEQAEKGATVKVPVTVNGDTGTAGFVVEFAYDQNLTFTGFEWGDAYTGKATMNMNDQIVVWADANGENQKAADDATVLYLVFTAPDTVGKYPVRIYKLDSSDKAGIALVIEKEDGYVEVVDETTTTTTTTTGIPEETTTTTSEVTTTTSDDTTTTSSGVTTTTSDVTTTTTPISGGSETTTTPITTSGSGSSETTTTPITTSGSGSSETTTTPITTTGSGSSETTTTPITTSGSGSSETTTTPVSGGSETTTTPVSGGSETTTTPISGGSDTTTTPISGGSDTSTTPNTGTSTTPVADPGHVVYQIGDVTGQPGTTVAVPIKVWFDDGTAGFTMQFDPNGLKIAGITYGDAYSGDNNEFTWNPDENVLIWASPDGENQKAAIGSTIAYLMVEIPDGVPEGMKYPIEFVKGSVEATDTNGKILDTQTMDGSITIVKKSETDGPNTPGTGETTDPKTSSETEPGQDTETMPGTSTTPNSGGSETTTEPITTSGSGSSETTTEPITTPGSGGSETTTTPITTPGSGSSETTTEPITTSGSGSSETTTEPITTTGSGSGEETTTTKVVTSYSISFEPPTRVNYWSHDTRTFKESRGLKDLAASLTIFKYYSDSDAIPEGAEPFFTDTIDVTAYTHPAEIEDGPKKVWEKELKEKFGDSWTVEQERETKLHKNTYSVDAFFFPTEFNDNSKDAADHPDFCTGDPIKLGQFNIYIGVKGDVNLDNVVSAEDPQLVLEYYTDKIVAQLGDVLINPVNKVDPVYEGEDGLCFYLGDVEYKDYDGNMVDPPLLDVADAQDILVYYTDKYVALLDDVTWESVVGYDLLDSFYGGVEE